MRPLLPAHIAQLRTYRPGRTEAHADGWAHLASNENAWGPSPRAVRAVASAAEHLHRYPDPGAEWALLERLAEVHEVKPEQVFLGAGSTSLIELVARTFLAPEQVAVVSAGSFPMYAHAVRCAAGRVRWIPLRDHGQDLLAMGAALEQEPRPCILYVANPDNPTGRYPPAAALQAFLTRAPDDVVVVIDNAYQHFVSARDYAAYPERDMATGGRRIVLYTFSKAYALAALRIGYGIASEELVDALRRVRAPYGVSRVAQVAALEALEDEAHLERSVRHNHDSRAYVCEELDRLGVPYVAPSANFVLIHCGRPSYAVHQALRRRGVVVRRMDGWGHPQAIRVSFGYGPQNRRFIDALTSVLRHLGVHGTTDRVSHDVWTSPRG